MRTAFHYPEMGIVAPKQELASAKKRLFFRLLKNKTLKAIFSIDETLCEFVEKIGRPLSTKIRYLPDAAEFNGSMTRIQARNFLSIPDKAVVILVYGTLSLRKKAVDVLLQVADQKGFPEHVHILLAGQQDDGVHQLMHSPIAQKLRALSRLYVLDKFIPQDDEYAVFKASDIVWLGYRDHYGMSGVLLQAGKMGLPILACKEGLIGWLTEKHALGVTCDLRFQNDVLDGIRRLIEDIDAKKALDADDRWLHFSNNTVRDFVRALLQDDTKKRKSEDSIDTYQLEPPIQRINNQQARG
jgi:Glycosyltransferase